jgi:hypothetical protein
MGKISKAMKIIPDAMKRLAKITDDVGEASRNTTKALKRADTGPAKVAPAKTPAKPPSSDFPPKNARDKVPASWGEGKANKKGVGRRWQDPKNQGNGVRVDQGNPNHELPSQRVDHVIVRKDGKVVGRNGEPIEGSIKDDPTNAHIPMKDWEQWSSWDKP